MGFEYRYRSMMVYTYRGYKFRKTQTLGSDGRHVYQINDDSIEERMDLTTIKKTRAYIDQLIEKDMATPQTQEDKIDRILDILERVNKIATEGNQECRIRVDIIIKPKEDTND